MLSELCVRRPVFATMLVMSLVVLGIFSFRDLGVDLFPRADPATVNVSLSPARRQPRRDLDVGDRADGGGAQRHRRHRRDVRRASREGSGQHHGPVRARARPQRRRERRAREGRRRDPATCRPKLLPPVITKVDPDADPVMSLIVSSNAMSLRTLTEIADKQISARHPDRSTASARSASSGGRAREIHIVVDIEKLERLRSVDRRRCATRSSTENVEIPGGTRRAGQGQLLLRTLGRVDATAGLQRHRRRDHERHADPHLATSATPRTASSGRRTRRVAGRHAGGDARRPPRDGREHRRGHRGRAREARARSGRRCRASVTLTVIRDDSRFIYASIASLEEHLLCGSLFAAHRRDVLHPQHPRRDHLVAGDSGVDHRDVHADARHGLHAEQHDAARASRSPSASSSTMRSWCWRTSSATSRRRTARRSRPRSRARAR